MAAENAADELEEELAKIVLERVESQRREADEHVLRQVVFRLRMQPLIGAVERLQVLGLRDLRHQLIRMQYLKPIEGVRIEFGRFTATLIAQANGNCRIELMHNEGSMMNVDTFDSVGEDELPARFREIMHGIAAEGERPR
ncbi:MAG TPA: hypothetical protein VMB81_09125 [Candidatus Sulfotelmatobacter sp.]|nr:hypothetical protein [Candidatus Sulfotelmatobacter sp.]